MIFRQFASSQTPALQTVLISESEYPDQAEALKHLFDGNLPVRKAPPTSCNSGSCPATGSWTKLYVTNMQGQKMEFDSLSYDDTLSDIHPEAYEDFAAILDLRSIVETLIGTVPLVAKKGTLKGKLSIGPLCPLEPCTLSDETKKAVYGARKIQIYSSDKSKLIDETIADYKTTEYGIMLPVGQYLVSVTNAGLGMFTPIKVTITHNRTTELDLDVDTGIR